MKTSVRVFYVLYVEGEVLADCLDAIRVLSRPEEKCRSHITVRGPYRRKISRSKLRGKAKGSKIVLEHAGHFFDAGQNTVFIRCSAPELKAVWFKPDFPEFNPHLTLFDGTSRDFAVRLFDVVNKYDFGIGFCARNLEPFVSVGGQSAFSLAAHFDSTHLSEIVREDLRPAEIAELNANERLTLIDRICSHLHDLASKHSVDWDQLSWKGWSLLMATRSSGEDK